MTHVLFKGKREVCCGCLTSPVAKQHPTETMREAVNNNVRKERDNHLKKGNLDFGFGIKMENEVIKVVTGWVTNGCLDLGLIDGFGEQS